MASILGVGDRPVGIQITFAWVRQSALAAAFLFRAGSPILAQAPDIDRAYHRATEILTRGAWVEMDRYLDSLQQAAHVDPDVRLLHALMSARTLRYKDRTTEAYWALDSLTFDTATAPPILYFSWASERAQNFRDLELYEPGREAARRALRMARQLGLVEQLVNTRTVLAEIDLHEGRFDDALEVFQQAQLEAAAENYGKGVCNALIGQGNVRYMQERDEDALQFYRQAMDCAKVGGFIHVLHSATMNAAAALSYVDGQEASIALYQELLVSLNGHEYAGLRAEVMTNLASLHSEMDDHDTALREVDEAWRIRSAMNDSAGIASVQLFRATALWALERKAEALAAIEQCQQLARSPRLKADAAWKAAGFLRAMGRLPEALAQLDVHRSLADSLAARKLGERIARLEVQHGSVLKDRTIEEQQLVIALERTQVEGSRRQRNVVLGIAGLVVVIALLLWRGLRIRQKLALRERELHAQQVDELLHQQEIKAINAMLEGQEKERDRVAKDLHDRLGSMLSAIKMQVGALEGGVQEVRSTQEAQHRKVERLLDEAVGEVRRISHDMVATTLSRFGLAKALEDLCDSVRVSGRLAVELQLFGLEQRMERAVEITVYRIIQELVSNVLKHAQASELSISVTREPGRLSVMVTDDGKGFDPALAGKGIGLQNVRSRAAALGATVQLDSVPGKGTTVSVECPVVE